MSWHRPNSTAGPITSPFGKRGPIPGAPDASTYHLGVDLRAGTLGVTSDIYAATAGTVRRIYKTPLGAWVLELDHGDGVRTRYAHMQQAGIAVKVGAKVAGGQRVAAASNSGAPTVHLHFEVLINGTQVDPVPYLKARGVDLTITTTPTQEDDMTPAQAAQLKQTLEHAGENRRMLGVLLGYNAPANDTETKALAKIWGESEDAAETRRMLGVILGWQGGQGPETDALARLTTTATTDPEAIANAILTSIGPDLAAQVAANLTITTKGA